MEIIPENFCKIAKDLRVYLTVETNSINSSRKAFKEFILEKETEVSVVSINNTEVFIQIKGIRNLGNIFTKTEEFINV